MLLENRVALITGASGGIGSAITLRFAAEGALVVLADLNEQGLEKLRREVERAGGLVHSIVTDVSRPEDVVACFEEIMERQKRLDILVNNAGICKNVAILDITPEEWDRLMVINLKSVFLCSKEAFRIMKLRKHGKVINMGSAAGKIGGVVAGAHYSAAKAGVLCFTKSLALQAAPYGINVNGIAPGPISTRMTKEWGEEVNRAFVEKIPLKRYGKPEEVAELALFLASDRSDYMTGEIIDLNGGLVMD